MPPRRTLTGVFLTLTLVAVACSHTEGATRARSEPAPSAADDARSAAISAPGGPRPSDGPGANAPSAASPADTRSAAASPAALSDDGARAWTDASVLAELARDCGWTPHEDAAEQSEASSRTSPLSCKFLLEQSCVPDPCLDEQEEKCKPACTKTCGACGDKCVKGCTKCKAGCTDDACKLACAKQCGECRQACVAEADRCATGTCNAAREKCTKDRQALYVAHRAACNKACPIAGSCPGDCSAKSETQRDACWKQCERSFVASGCPRTFYGYCVMAGGFGGEVN
jgi:hypothetical protein